MAEQIKVKVDPNPIQRNKHDVAMELLNLHLKFERPKKVSDLETIYTKYYALAIYCESSDVVKLQNLLSDSLKDKAGRLKEVDLSELTF
ncbi:hypothetical protein FIU87_03305 [Bacillus sp. THAF10]|uniref:hypothetical protein n=1 Tax=Bacillus sp. THAF10 TaxID=2587848 RepID=UPI001268C04F|nr:hypothetical protein [Bacillus sp. THAF10]QFT87669.1 hypothetical protein FIU87_03305 [Bacillus sp. THAF10]